MRKIAVAILFVGFVSYLCAGDRITIRAARVLDGHGGVVINGTVVVEGAKIVGIERETKNPTYDLPNVTLLPGFIDTHVHISWHFDQDGKSHDPETAVESGHSLPYGLENAFSTLLGGVTTVQSLGSPADQELACWIEHGSIPGPTVLTSLEPVTEETGDPEAIRKHVRDVIARGANVIKVFASKSIRDGGGPTLSQDQLNAACGEAKSHGLRSAVHAHGIESARRAVLAGCTSIEHGVLLDDDTLQFIADRGVYFDPNIGLIFQNYFENKQHFLGIGNYTEEGFAKMQEAVPIALKMFQHALKIKNLKIVFGTDAVAGSHGRNLEELIYRVLNGGQSSMSAIVSATSLSAECLGLQDHAGSIGPGMEADLIGVAGNPLEDITALRKIVFVMKSGRTILNRSIKTAYQHS